MTRTAALRSLLETKNLHFLENFLFLFQESVFQIGDLTLITNFDQLIMNKVVGVDVVSAQWTSTMVNSIDGIIYYGHDPEAFINVFVSFCLLP